MEEWDRNEYHTGTANMFEMVSLQTPVKDKDGEQYTTLGDSLASPDSDVLHGIMHEEMKEEVSRIVESLPVSQNTVLRMHYYQNVDMQDIAKTMGISPSRVSQLHRSAMNAMKERLRDVVY
jgi:RNA polymerase sigma factor for flagellar operon FliA